MQPLTLRELNLPTASTGLTVGAIAPGLERLEPELGRLTDERGRELIRRGRRAARHVAA